MNLNIKILLSFSLAAFLLVGCQKEEAPSDAQQSNVSTAAEKNNQAETERAASEQSANQPQETASNASEHSHSDGSHDHSHGHEHAEPAADTPLVVVPKKYTEVEPQMSCEKPVVMEFYAYHCPHCYHLEPEAEAWRQKNADKVEFVSVPTHLGHQQLGVMLLAHHAAKKLGVLEKTQHALFKRFHEEKKLFSSQQELAEFLVAQGADLDKANQVLADQAAISEAINADFEILNKYKITSVPQVLVNHQYITSTSLAGGPKEVFKVVDQLLELPHQCKAK